jgi:valyl-tRNA synthetase
MVDQKFDLVTQGRNLRREANVPANKKVKYVLKATNPLPPLEIETIRLLLNAEELQVNADYEPPKGTPVVQHPLGDLFLPLEGVQDVGAEKTRLQKEVEKVDSEIAKVETKLQNPAFTQKAPAKVLAEHQQRLADWISQKERLQAALARLDV